MTGIADLGGMSVTLTAIEARWNQSMNNAKKQLGDVDAKLSAVTKASHLMRAAFVIGGAAVVAMMGNMVLKAAALGEEIQNNTKLTGTSAREFTELAYAGRTVGVSMEGMADAIKEASENTSKAASGAEKQAIAIRAIGASIEELQRMTPAQRFERIAQGISELKDPGDRARAALDLLGGSGVRLLPLLSQGAEGIKAMREEAQRLGQSFSEEQIAKLADASDAVDRLKESWSGFATTMSAKVAPALAAVLDLAHGDFAGAADNAFGGGGRKNGTPAQQLKQAQFEMGYAKKGGYQPRIDEVQAEIDRLNMVINGVDDFASRRSRAMNAKAPAGGYASATAEADAEKARQEAAKKAQADAIKQRQEFNEAMVNGLNDMNTEITRANNEFYADQLTSTGDFLSADMEQKNAAHDAEIEARAQRLEELRAAVMTEEELEAEKYAHLLDLLNNYTDEELKELGGRNEAAARLEQDHMDRLKDIRSKGLTDLEKFNAMSWQQQTENVVGSLAQMASGITVHNKKTFEINKAAALANAIVSTAAGVTKALETYPPPLSFAMAAAQAAAGAAQIAAIRGAKYNGGGAASSPTTPAVPTAARTAQTISISGLTRDQLFSGSQVRGLLEKLQEALDDGGKLVFD